MYGLLYPVALVLLFLIALCVWRYGSVPSNLPPGPTGLPILGSSLSTWNNATLHTQLRQWTQKYGPVFRVYVGNVLCVILGDYATICEALVKQGGTYAGRPAFHNIFPKDVAGLGLTNSEGEMWTVHRRFALQTLRDFGFGRTSLEPRIKDEAVYLVDAVGKTNGRAFDPGLSLASASSNIISTLVFGRRFDYEDDDFSTLLKTLRSRALAIRFSFLSPFVLSEEVAKFVANLPQTRLLKSTNDDFVAFIEEQITMALLDNSDLSNEEPTNYIEAYRKVQLDETKDGSKFTHRQLVANVTNLFMGGSGTVAATLRWTIFILAHHPEVQERVYEEIKRETGDQSFLNYADRKKLPFTEATIMELLRTADLAPSGLLRRTLGPSMLEGYDIPAGTVIVPLLTAILNDPKVFPDPQAFDPTRFLMEPEGTKPDTHTRLIPFALGKRRCLGESLARMELFIFFTALISKFRFSFPTDRPKPPLVGSAEVFRGTVPCQVVAERRGE